jgi:signal peptidase
VKIAVRTVSIILGLIVAGLAFVFFSPDYDIYVVRSGSMKPAINMGDVVIAGPVGASSGIKPGVIITYELGKNLITHRVLSVDNNTLITKGDANEDPDPSPVQFSQVKSRYLFKIPYVGYLTSFVRTRLGWFLAIILPTIALVGFMVKDIIKEALKNENGVKNIMKTDKPVQNIAGSNDHLKNFMREALQGYDFPETRAVAGKTKHKITNNRRME